MLVIVSGTSANAYSLSEAAEPRERPPSGYSSDVYVDSRGCAYVRANIGNTVNWVPRLTGDRKQVVCGLTPSLNTRRASAPPPPLAAAPTPAPVTPASAPVATAPAAAPTAPAAPTRTLTVTCPADGSPARVRVGTSTIRVTCAPGQTRPATTMVSHPNGERTRLIVNPPAPAALPVVTARAPAAAAAPVVPVAPLAAGSARVRIGGVPPGGAGNNFGSGYGVGGGSPVAAPVPSATAPRPAPAYRAPAANAPAAPAFGSGYGLPVQPDAGRVHIPAGYRPAWEDDRLNPNRGPRSALGDAQMAATWTDDLPMRRAEGAGAVISTKGAAAPAPVATAARYVQVGVFANPANATAAANRLAGLGLPGRIGKTASGMSVVLAGPFTDAGALQSALATARRGGFSDAFARS